MRFNYGKIFLLGFGFFGVSVIWATYNSYVPIFLREKFGLEPVLVGFFMVLDNIAALLIQPPVGAWSDRLHSPLGRRMPFILIGAPIGAIAFGFIPLTAVLPLFVACTTTLLLSMAFWRTPVVALMPDITPSDKRSQANGIINFMGGVGTIIAFLGGSRLYDLDPAYPFWLGSGLVILAALLVFLLIREPKVIEDSQQERPSMITSLGNIFRDPDRSALRVFLAIFCWFVAYNAVDTFFTSYTKYYLGLSESDGSRLLGQLSLFFVLFALPAGILGSRIGRRITISMGIVIMALCLLPMYFAPVTSLTLVLTRLPVLGQVPIIGVILMVAGIGWAFININSLPMVVDMTTFSYLGTYTGLYYLFSTLAAIAGPIITGGIIQFSGNNYRTTMIAAPFFMVLAFIMMWGVRRGEAVRQPKPSLYPG